MPALSYSITISDGESAYLKSLIKTRTIQAQVVDRARILLWKSEVKTDKAIADGLGISVNTVRRCIDRYLNGGINLAGGVSCVAFVIFNLWEKRDKTRKILLFLGDHSTNI